MRMKRKVIGVDLGGTNIRAAVVDSEGNILGKNQRNTLAERRYEDILEDIASTMCDAAYDAGIAIVDNDTISAIGVGSPGPLDSKNGLILNPPNLRTMHEKYLGPDLKKAFGVPVKIANDAHCAGLGECWLGAARGY